MGAHPELNSVLVGGWFIERNPRVSPLRRACQTEW